MALLGSLNTGASGVKTHGKAMQLIGNNIANVNTFGYKANDVAFEDLMGNSWPQGSAVTKAYLNAQLTGSVTSSGLDYLRKNYVKVATGVTGSATASFAATTASAPSGMTATSESDFIFFMNGGYMEHNAIDVEQSGSIFLLKINTSDLGYNLESDDEIIAQGKFNS